MKLTHNGKFFILANLIVVALFYKGIDFYGGLTGERSGFDMSIMALLAITMLVLTAWILLKHENERQHKINLKLIYHLISVITALIGWGIAYVLSDYVQPIDLAWIVALGSGSLLAHWLGSRNKTKGINSKKAFL